MLKQPHREVLRSRSPNLCLLLTIITIFSTALLAPLQAHAQLPAGTSDASAQPVQQPQDPLRAQAAAALDKQDYPAALRLLTALAEKNPTDAHVLYDLASTQDALDQPTAAEATYRRAIVADPAFFDPHVALGLLLARNGKLDEARAELAAAVTLKTDNQPHKARAYRALAQLDASTRPADASAELLNALKLSSETPDDIFLSGEIAEFSQDLPAAETAYRRFLASSPQDARRNANGNAALAHVLIREHKPAEAETALTAALSKNPDDPTLNAQLASLYEQQNQPEKALPIVEKLHAAHPADSNLTRLLARIYSRNNQFDKAEPLYAALIAANPADPTLVTDRADALMHLKNFSEAEAILKRALAQPTAYPTQADLALAASHLAFAASANNDPAVTLQALAISAKVQPKSPSDIFLEATARDKLKQVKQASDLYKQFLSVAGGKFPDEEWEARHRLLTLEHAH